MKILHITDSHATVKAPKSRQDVYYYSFLRKLYEVGYIVKHSNIDLILHTGDLFHSPHISDKFTGQVAEIIKTFNVPMYVVPGNHDIDGYNIDTLEQTKLGLLYKTGVVRELDRLNPLKLSTTINNNKINIAISGQEYYPYIDSGNADDFLMQQTEADLNILCIHGYIADKPQNPNIKHTLISNINTDADIVLSGHFHQSFCVERNDGVGFYNPGSMMRTEQNEYNKTHMPSYGILEISCDNEGVFYNYELHKFKTALASDIVFDFNNKIIEQQKIITLDTFKYTLSNTVSNIKTNINAISIIDELSKKQNIDKEVYDLVIDTINKSKQDSPDTFDVKQGYIVSKDKIYIKKLEINNFQSHKNTVLEFNDNLNVIVGVTNNGKTSIIRAILWVIDDYPSGNAFITTNEKQCSVKITFSNNSYIERKRTLSSPGSYKIGYYDENNQFIESEYKGFHNEIPVEVLNIHQMPLINITKDLVTHLNVMNQFDKPFLLTESPIVKASAIGRITGTHIIDNAVKLLGKDKLSYSKDIKTHTNTLKELEEKKNNLRDVDKLKLIEKNINVIRNKIIDLNNQLNQALDINNNYKTYKYQLDWYLIKLNKCNAILDKKDLFNLIFDKYDLYKKSLDLNNIYHNNLNSLSDYNNSLFKNKLILELGFVINQLKSFDKYNNLYIKYNNLITERGINLIRLDIYKNVLNIKPLITNIENNYDNYNKCLKLQENYSNNIDLLNNKTIELDKINKLKEQILVDIQTEINGILKDNICPCCGQKINNDHKENIFKYLSRE